MRGREECYEEERVVPFSEFTFFLKKGVGNKTSKPFETIKTNGDFCNK